MAAIVLVSYVSYLAAEANVKLTRRNPRANLDDYGYQELRAIAFVRWQAQQPSGQRNSCQDESQQEGE